MKLKEDEAPGTVEKRATQEVQDLMTARWVADMIGVAAELELADFINAGAKTAEEIAKAKGLHASPLYRLLRGLASHGIFAEQEDGTFAQTPRSNALRKDAPHSAWGMAQLTTRPWAVHTWMKLGHNIRAGTPASDMFMGCHFSTTSTSTPMNWNCLPKPCAVFPWLPVPRFCMRPGFN